MSGSIEMEGEEYSDLMAELETLRSQLTAEREAHAETQHRLELLNHEVDTVCEEDSSLEETFRRMNRQIDTLINKNLGLEATLDEAQARAEKAESINRALILLLKVHVPDSTFDRLSLADAGREYDALVTAKEKAERERDEARAVAAYEGTASIDPIRRRDALAWVEGVRREAWKALDRRACPTCGSSVIGMTACSNVWHLPEYQRKEGGGE